ncbi:diguanylate cyclase (GGDEF)-like protein/PAS domain S-box-containing protein [Novosphingobium sediminicola]|uniref:Diguanylate cyclase (GGDEF)-like protein/PAS domain S-box-containing protein n=1 Tax=Novosphingobium sediminicola TaxID=563162 RepID=A0A7W6CD26_9SPHN|nr:diguanylate cyclase (GGDEF)-like protein/PAS domain S-box-containing protein [Novosphingobium sediminicola]
MTHWLLSTREQVSAPIAAQLANGLFGSLPIFIGGVINSVAVAAVAAGRMHTAPFIGWLVFEALLGLVRIGVVQSSHSATPERLERLRHLASLLSVAWATSVGVGALLCLTSGDWVLATIACLSTAAMVCGICLRNFGTPRLAAVMTFAALAPCALGGLMTQEPSLRIISVQLPIFMVTIFSASFGLHRMLVSWMTTTAELERSKALNETILQSNPDLTLILDADHRIVFSNRQPEELVCQSVLTGRDFCSVLEEKDRPAAAAALARAQRGELTSFTTCFTRPTGEKLWFDTVVNETSDASGRFIVVARDITRQKHSEERAIWMAHHDTLTGLPNRAVLQDRLDAALMQADGRILAVDGDAPGHALLIVDVDNFKIINDTLGHDGGDVLLRALAARLRAAVGHGDLVARTGGDEFALIVAARDDEALHRIAARIYEELREPILHGDRVMECGASIGASFIPLDGPGRSEVMKAADIALYAAKAAGRAQMKIFEPAMMDEVERHQAMITAARFALKRKTILPHYQPKVCLTGEGRIVGFEALLRWRDRDGHVRGPDAIQAAFNDPILSVAISDYMLEMILNDIEGWVADGVAFGHVAVNVTSGDFRPGGIVETVLDRLKARNLPASCLQIEVTEDVFLDKGALDVERALKRLSHHGLRIALDDFGTGYASLSHLTQFPVDLLKIDRSFIGQIGAKGDAEAISSIVINLGHCLGLEVIAEGVETVQQQEHLITMGCDTGQGYLYARAMPAADVSGHVREHEAARALIHMRQA